MVNYNRYMNLAGILQKDMVRVIQKEYPHFSKTQASLACNPARNALQLLPEAEALLEAEFGKAPGLSISPRFGSGKSHGNKNKPNRLCVRLDNSLRSRVQKVYEQMCFVTMQDLIEAAIAEFVSKYERSA